MQILVGIGIFLFVVLVIEGGYLAFKNLHSSEEKAVKKRLQALSSVDDEDFSFDLTRRRVFSEVPWFNRFLLRFPITERMGLLLRQAGVRHTLGFLALLSALLAFIGFLIGLQASSSYPISFFVALLLCVLPFVHVLLKRRKRLEKFHRQLPEALDLVARAMRAGHAFSGALKMVADEMDDPIGVEFDQTLKEINFGVAVPEALRSLANRVGCLDLKFFVISVIIQRETGGNLAGILENIAHIIRERFKLRGRIQILASEGKLSATVLVGLPFFVALVLSLINPGYVGLLVKDPIGKALAALGLVLMGIGIFTMKRMIAIKV